MIYWFPIEFSWKARADGKVTFGARAANGRRCRRSVSVVPARSTNAFSNGQRLGCSCDSGRRVWPSMTKWKALLGDGKASTGPWSRHRLLKNLSDPTRRIGGKNGSKRMLLVDERGAPLSVLVPRASRKARRETAAGRGCV